MIRTTLACTFVALAAAFAHGDEVVLTTGETLQVANVVAADGRVEMDHAVLGHLSVAADKVRSIRRDGDAAPAAAPGAPAKPATPTAPPAPPAPEWKFKAELGLTGTSGNTRTQDLRAAIGALLEETEHRWKFDAVYNRARTEGETTKNNFYAEGLHDWIFRESPWLAFATARYDRDRFQAWDSRYSVGGGVGYTLSDTEKLKARLRAGLNFIRENGGPDDGDWRPEGMLGAEATYKLTENQTLDGSVRWFPDLEDSGEYRLLSSLSWSIKLSDEGLSLKAGIEHEYDTHREDPFEKDDVKYFVALLFEF